MSAIHFWTQALARRWLRLVRGGLGFWHQWAATRRRRATLVSDCLERRETARLARAMLAWASYQMELRCAPLQA